ncbi:hypothetical protein IF1G_00086 [Cordyceps javanica]|uniref:Uncharacterized protein n=1 Tax=Cordyceps javanica TaxID=43265 RepID=A0A545VEK5_9HYPO|nr:hypothetical protein IF1G_00086 [Cordyceps javanica]
MLDASRPFSLAHDSRDSEPAVLLQRLSDVLSLSLHVYLLGTYLGNLPRYLERLPKEPKTWPVTESPVSPAGEAAGRLIVFSVLFLIQQRKKSCFKQYFCGKSLHE